MHFTKDGNESFVRHGLANCMDKKPIESPVFYSIHFIKANGEYQYCLHKHPKFEIIIPTAGMYKCKLNGSDLEVEKGRLLLVQAGDMHQDLYTAGLEFCVLTFDFKDIGSLFNDGLGPESQIMALPDDPVFSLTLPLLEKVCDENGPFSYYALSGLFLTLFWRLLESADKDLLNPCLLERSIQEAFKSRLIRQFESGLSRKLDIERTANALGMSKSSLSHKTRQILGTSVAKEFMSFKMHKAKSLLYENGMSIKEVSAFLGFKNQFYFSKSFKRVLGVSPSQLT